MKKSLLFVAAVMIFAATSGSLQAATLTELQAQLKMVMAQLSALQSEANTTMPHNGIVSCPNLNRNLARGMRGSDVMELQQFLITQKLLATDSATGFFGAMTESSVKQFQCKEMGICSGTAQGTGYGVVGPKTRAGIAARCHSDSRNSTSDASSATPQSSGASSTRSPSSNTTSGENGGQNSVGTSGSGQLHYAQANYTSASVPVNPSMRYVNPAAIVPMLTPYSGSNRTLQVPDTLDIAQRAGATISALTTPLDAEHDYQLYWLGVVATHPASLYMSSWEALDTKFWEALPLLRSITGSVINTHVDAIWQARMVRSLSNEGPIVFSIDRDYLTPFFSEQNRAYLATEYLADVLAQGRTIATIAHLYTHTGDAKWKEYGQRMIDGLANYYHTNNGKHYFSGTYFTLNKKFPPGNTPYVGYQAAETDGRMIQGPAQFYLATGYEPALAVARGFARRVMYDANVFNLSTGAFIADTASNVESGSKGAHFMVRTKILDSLLDYVAATRKAGQTDQDTLAFVHKSYEWIKANPHVHTEIGWFPEYLSPTSVTTDYGAVDMVSLAVKLSQLGVADYWDDVDVWVRNQFAEGQLLETSWINTFTAPKTASTACNPAHGHACTFANVPTRLYGAWGGWIRPNEYLHNGATAIVMQDSTGNAARTLHLLWKYMTVRVGSIMKVNVLLTKASPDVSVVSYIPYSGRTDITIVAPGLTELHVRIPKWVDPAEVVITRNNSEIGWTYDEQYARISSTGMNPGDVFSVTFPITESTRVVNLPSVSGGLEGYTFTFKGSTVVDVVPKGSNYPRYADRAKYRSAPLMSTKTFFVPSGTELGVQFPHIPSTRTSQTHLMTVGSSKDLEATLSIRRRLCESFYIDWGNGQTVGPTYATGAHNPDCAAGWETTTVRHTYSRGGNFKVSIKVFNPGGTNVFTDSKTQLINGPLPQGELMVSPLSGPSPLVSTVSGKVNSGGMCAASTYTISFGDLTSQEIVVPAGLCAAKDFSVQHSYASPGSYDVYLFAGSVQQVQQNQAGNPIASQKVNVQASNRINATPASGGAPLVTQVTGVVNADASCAADVYTISFGDFTAQEISVPPGFCAAKEFSVQHSYTSAGTYDLYLFKGSIPQVQQNQAGNPVSGKIISVQ